MDIIVSLAGFKIVKSKLPLCQLGKRKDLGNRRDSRRYLLAEVNLVKTMDILGAKDLEVQLMNHNRSMSEMLLYNWPNISREGIL